MLLIYVVASLICASPCSSASSTRHGWAQTSTSPGVRPAVSSGPRAESSARARETRKGVAAFISVKMQGRKTASGQLYDGRALVAAHPTYPMGTVLRVTSRENGRAVDVTVVDRSASGAKRPIVDVSRAAAEQLDFVRSGTVAVTTEVITWGSDGPRK